MPSDIFISYSRKDSEQAIALAEKLRIDGMDVWIDQAQMEAAGTWSREIVSATSNCKAFAFLVSTAKFSNVLRKSERTFLLLEK